MRFNRMKFSIILLAAGAVFASVTVTAAGDAIQVGYVEGEALQPIPEGQPVYQESCPDCERRGHRRHRGFFKALFSHKKLHSPAEGWSRVVKQPVRRTPVRYRRYWPSKWAGQPGAGLGAPHYPMVYMPTDTTQMGYYYQGTPQWMPNPSMIPPAPHPYQWHRRECPMGLPVNHYGEVVYQGTVNSTEGYSSPQEYTPQQNVPQIAPQPAVPTPASPQELVPPNPVEEKAV